MAATVDLVALTSRERVRRALVAGSIVRVARGRLALPSVGEAPRRAHAVSGVLSHGSAAAWWGWGQKAVPEVPQVTVPKDRRVVGDRAGIHFVDLRPHEVHDGIVTSPERTLVDCLRTSSYDAGLAVAESALRSGRVDDLALQRVAAVRGPGSARVRRVVADADVRAANPFESVLRALALTAGLAPVPQQRIQHGREWIVPDLVDAPRRLVLEADSFAWHGNRAALRNDCRRYTWLARHGWCLMRFAWEDVMHQQDYVLEVLRDMVAPDQRTKRGSGSGNAA